MRLPATRLIAAIAAIGFVATAASAHRQWMLPSSTVVSGDDMWVTVDAAVSNDLFYFEHFPMRLEGIKAWAPDGSEAKIENGATGRYRSTFDVHLTQKGTYKIASEGGGVMGRYKVNGETKRLPRGAKASDIAAIPANATDVEIGENWNRNEIFVTSGEPTDTVLKPTGKGLELVPVTHPNDLVAGEPATFRFVVDGKPAAGVKVTVIPGGIRYRDQLNQRDYTTDAAGEIKVDWATPGMYWLNAGTTDNHVSVPKATERRLGYITTLEVMAP